jgi:hypothetical protein
MNNTQLTFWKKRNPSSNYLPRFLLWNMTTGSASDMNSGKISYRIDRSFSQRALGAHQVFFLGSSFFTTSQLNERFQHLTQERRHLSNLCLIVAILSIPCISRPFIFGLTWRIHRLNMQSHLTHLFKNVSGRNRRWFSFNYPLSSNSQ